ncbi:MAG: glycosyltransferase family 39 protein [Candidatus Omnitrophica bacterium]|nr:glycosyltransferase family 39 protein [Candidatus Omnitrophota bacterium]
MTKRSTRERFKQFLSWGAILAVVIIVSIIKLHLFEMPLERDEGEYAYIAQLLMHGEPLYLNAYTMKLPAIYFVYAAFMSLFGQSPYGIHMGLVLITAVTIILVFLLTKRLLGAYAGVIAGTAFALLTLGKYALAFNIEHLIILLVLAGSLILLYAIDRGGGFLLSGLIFGLAFIAKQHAVFFILFGVFYIFWTHIMVRPIRMLAALKRIGLFFTGAALPFIFVCFYIYATGAFNAFRFWVFEYAAKYCSFMTLSDGIKSFLYVADKIVGSSPIVWIISGVGLIAGVWSRLDRDKIVFITGFSIFSFLAVTPGLYFRHHYFILIFPVVAIFAGIAARYTGQFLSTKGIFLPTRNIILAAMLILFFSLSIFQQKRFLFQLNPVEACRDIYNRSPFAESVEISRYIEANSGKEARVLVLGSEPQIYFYLHRPAPVKYIYMYPLLESTPYALNMQKKFIEEAESSKSEYVICVNIDTSWFNGYVSPNLAKPLFDWVNAYPRKYYDVVGVADIISRNESIYCWGDKAKEYKLKSDKYIVIFKRKIS